MAGTPATPANSNMSVLGFTPGGAPGPVVQGPGAPPPAVKTPDPLQGQWGQYLSQPFHDFATAVNTGSQAISDAPQKAVDAANKAIQADIKAASDQVATWLRNSAVDIVIIVLILLAVDNLFKPDYSKFFDAAGSIAGAAAKGAEIA